MWEIFEQILNEKGLTMTEVSRMSGISQSTLSNWKARRNYISAKNGKILAEVLGVSYDYLMGGAWSPKTSTSGRVYHFSDKTAEMAELLTKRPDLMDLLIKAEKLDSGAVLAVSAMLDAFVPTKAVKVG